MSAPQSGQTSGRDSNGRGLFPSRRHGPETVGGRAHIAQRSRGRWVRLGAAARVVGRIAPEGCGRGVGRERLEIFTLLVLLTATFWRR